jgi:hypothetical protein
MQYLSNPPPQKKDKNPLIKQSRHTIPRLFHPPPPRMLVDCGVIEVSDRAVRSNSPAPSQIATSILPSPPAKNSTRIPFKKRSRHAISRPFQPKPHRPTFDCHVFRGCPPQTGPPFHPPADSPNIKRPPTVDCGMVEFLDRDRRSNLVLQSRFGPPQ